MCINTGALPDQNFILPTLTLRFTHRYVSHDIRCLLDLGSQRSYLHSSLIDEFQINSNLLREFTCKIKTFNGVHSKCVKEGRIYLDITSGRNILIPIIFSDVDLDFKVENLDKAIGNIKQYNYQLADSHFNAINGGNVSNIRGLLGSDVLQYLLPFSFTKLINGTAIEIAEGVIPFGNVGNFLTMDQLRHISNNNDKISF